MPNSQNPNKRLSVNTVLLKNTTESSVSIVHIWPLFENFIIQKTVILLITVFKVNNQLLDYLNMPQTIGDLGVKTLVGFGSACKSLSNRLQCKTWNLQNKNFWQWKFTGLNYGSFQTSQHLLKKPEFHFLLFIGIDSKLSSLKSQVCWS